MNSQSQDFTKLLSDARVQQLRQIFVQKAELFLVGGCVRDLIQGKETKDLDLACQLKTDEMLSILSNAGIRCIETGARHGTITAVIDQSNIEITTFRGKTDPKEKTEIALTADLELRDFTINTLAVSINTGHLHDPLCGLKDLQQRLLRAPPPASKRFKEDPLRILRMIRFGPAQGFTIESETYSAAKSNLAKLQQVSTERIQHEFSGILVSSDPRAALSSMLELGLIDLFFPEALASVGFEQNDFHTETVFEHTLSVVENCPAVLKLRLAGFFHDLGKPHTLSVDAEGRRHFYEHEIISTKILEEVMPRLRYSNDLTKSVSTIVRYHMRPVDCGPSGIRRLIRDLGPEFDAWRKFKEADHPPIFTLDQTMLELKIFDDKIKAEFERAELEKQKKLVITGYDLMEMGYKAGPDLGKVIKVLEEEVIDDPTRNTRDYLLERAQKLYTAEQK